MSTVWREGSGRGTGKPRKGEMMLRFPHHDSCLIEVKRGDESELEELISADEHEESIVAEKV